MIQDYRATDISVKNLESNFLSIFLHPTKKATFQWPFLINQYSTMFTLSELPEEQPLLFSLQSKKAIPSKL
jgi:hypothetical protein